MNRAFLCSAIEGLVSSYGYHFQLSNEAYFPTTVCRYPAAFMPQPDFVSMEGRKRGRITYKVVLRLAKQGAKLSVQKRNNLINDMEQEMIDLFVELSRSERIAVVDELTITTLPQAFDAHGALVVEATALVTTIF
ncbi:MAG: hypothetical protein IKL20_00115 [Alistipes sp.]|nr:hypothetical protein [Alistipes sp.]